MHLFYATKGFHRAPFRLYEYLLMILQTIERNTFFRITFECYMLLKPSGSVHLYVFFW